MPDPEKRSERIGINLTPHQNAKLKVAASTANQTRAGYVYELVCQALETDALTPLPHPSTTPQWVEQLGELYGILDVLTQQLGEQQSSDLRPLITALQAQIDNVQNLLLTLPQLADYQPE